MTDINERLYGDDAEMDSAIAGIRRGNAITCIMPYREYGTWVFDDPRVGLVREPFVLGIPEMIDEMVKDIPNAKKGFSMCFSLMEPPVDNHFHIKLMAEESGGGWYRDVKTRKAGWLCPATLNYFEAFPDEMYVWALELSEEDQLMTKLSHQDEIDRLGLKPSYGEDGLWIIDDPVFPENYEVSSDDDLIDWVRSLQDGN
jgi:hypothetical protein